MHRSILLFAAGIVTLILITSVTAATGGAYIRHSVPANPATRMLSGGADRSKAVMLSRQHVVHIGIKNLAFQPARVVIVPGTRVVWTNLDPFRHTLSSDSGIWNSGALDAGQQFALVFKKLGTYRYHCVMYPFIRATVVVRQRTRVAGASFFPSPFLAGEPEILRLSSPSHLKGPVPFLHPIRSP
jgi:plastocyanin